MLPTSSILYRES